MVPSEHALGMLAEWDNSVHVGIMEGLGLSWQRKDYGQRMSKIMMFPQKNKGEF